MDFIQFIADSITAAVKHGFSTTTFILVLVALFRIQAIRKRLIKRLPKRFRQEDRLERIERKLDAIAAHTGVPEWKDGALKIIPTGPTSSRPSFSLSQVVTYQVNQLRSVKKMNNVNWASLIITVLGAVKIVLEAFNVDLITDDQINSIANAAAAVATLVGVLISHQKPATEQLTEQEKVLM